MMHDLSLRHLVAETMRQPAGTRYTHAYGVMEGIVTSGSPDALADARAYARALEEAMQHGLTCAATARALFADRR